MDIKPETVIKILNNHRYESLTDKLINILKTEMEDEEIKDFEAWMKKREG